MHSPAAHRSTKTEQITIEESSSFDRELSRYEVAAKGHLATRRKLGKWSAFSAAVGAGLVMAQEAEEVIVFVPNQNIVLQPGLAPSAALDIDGGGANDFIMTVNGFRTASRRNHFEHD